MNQDKPHILYVDDEENNLVALKAVFRRYYHIHTATSAREALSLLRQHPVELIVTDQRMPEMTGVQFLEAVIPDYPDAIRMVLTGFSDVDAIIKAINTGRVYRYITKPWDEQELKMTIDGALELFKEQETSRRLMADLTSKSAEQERIMKLFQKYVPENVVQDALNTQEESGLFAGESRIIAVLFSDIRGFTSLSSHLAPEDLVAYLNEYFTLMTHFIDAHKGSVNKFLGDGLLALFGAPMSYIENQENAVYCALEMVRHLAAFNEKFRDKVGQDIQIGIGIDTGEVVVGNIGSEDRLEYTAVGETVEQAVWIESLTKTHPNSILISDRMYRIVKDVVEAEALPPQTMEGQEGPIPLYRVSGRIN